MASKIEKITPSPSVLQMSTWQEKQPVRCTEPGCLHVAANSSVLNLHRAKVHKLASQNDENVVKQYHCPVETCSFNKQSIKYFKSLDSLKVHYMKLHSEKKFKCNKCGKGYSLMRDCQRHQDECGNSYTCPQCNKVYNNKDALLKHCMYNMHTRPVFPPKPKPLRKQPESRAKKKKEPDQKEENSKRPLAFILPKQPPPIVVPIERHTVQLQTDPGGPDYVIPKLHQPVTQSVQTEALQGSMKTVSIQTGAQQQSAHGLQHTRISGEKLSMGTQVVLIVPPICASPGSPRIAQTQTGESILQSAMKSARIPVAKHSKATQKSPLKKTSQKRKHVEKLCTSSQTNFFTPLKKLRQSRKSTQVLKPTGQDVFTSPTGSGLWSTDILNSPLVPTDTHLGIYDDGNFNPDLDDPLNNMSTQTELSGLLDELLPMSDILAPNQMPLPQLQDCQTQTFNNILQSSLVSDEQSTSPQKLYKSWISDIPETFSEGRKCQFLSSQTQTTPTKNPLFLGHNNKSGRMVDSSIQIDPDVFPPPNIQYQEGTTQTSEPLVQSCFTQTRLPSTVIVPSMGRADQNTQMQCTSTQSNFTQTLQSISDPLSSQIYPNRACSVLTICSDIQEFKNIESNHVDVSQPFDNIVFVSERGYNNSSSIITPEVLQNHHKSCDSRQNVYDNGIDLLLDMDDNCISESGRLTKDKTIDVLSDESSKQQGQIQKCNNVSGTSVGESCSDVPQFSSPEHNIRSSTSGKGRNYDILSDIPQVDETGLEAGTQTFSDLGFNTGTQILSDLGFETGTQTFSDAGFDTGTQTFSETGFDTGTQTFSGTGFETGTQTLSDLGFETGTQTFSGTGFETGTQTFSDLGFETGTQTFSDLGFDTGTQTLSDLGFETGTQTFSDLLLEIGTQTMEEFFLENEMGTQTTWDTASQTLDDLNLEMGTQTLEEYIADSHTQTKGRNEWCDGIAAQTGDELLDLLTTNTHTQTQTGDELLDLLTRNTHTQTQTQDGLLQLFTTDTHTQTQSNDELFDLLTRDTHTQTQTGAELLGLLTTDTHTQTQAGDQFLDLLTAETYTQTSDFSTFSF